MYSKKDEKRYISQLDEDTSEGWTILSPENESRQCNWYSVFSQEQS